MPFSGVHRLLYSSVPIHTQTYITVDRETDRGRQTEKDRDRDRDRDDSYSRVLLTWELRITGSSEKGKIK